MQKMSVDEAQDVLFDQVYIPTFVKACADRGISFADEASLSDALESTALLKMSGQQGQKNLAKEAADALRGSLGVPNPEDLAHEAAEQKVASETAQEQTIQSALGTLVAAQNEQAAQQ